ncbi:hypothetical protein ACFXAF_03415 [Kitasatospora sp. NPDC059463]|uniref:hypothetical protein n=1 Tax=unclassified Kitasatospora TaxID=2633591 RepID=UPI0036B489D0
MIGAGVVTAVHAGDGMPLVPALCVDGFVLVSWLSIAAMAFPRRQPPVDPVDDCAAPPLLAALPYRAENEPRIAARWRGRHWP